MSLQGWSSLAVIVLVFEAFILLLIPAAVTYFLTRGVLVLLREIPSRLALVRGYLGQAQVATERASEAVAAPFIAVNASFARARSTLAGVRRLFGA
jgi:hypothetical protein